MRLDVWYDSLRDRIRFTTVSFFTILDPCMITPLISITTIVQKEVATDAPFCLRPFDSVWLRLPFRTTLSKKSNRLVITILGVLDGTASCQYDEIFVEKEKAPGEQGVSTVRSFFYGCSILGWHSLLSAV